MVAHKESPEPCQTRKFLDLSAKGRVLGHLDGGRLTPEKTPLPNPNGRMNGICTEPAAQEELKPAAQGERRVKLTASGSTRGVRFDFGLIARAARSGLPLHVSRRAPTA
jgi:hypothetical protein